MFATPLERAVRRQVRARLRSSEILWHEYLPRRRIERWRLAGQVLLVLVSPLLVAAAIAMSFMAAVLQHGIGMVANEGPFVGTSNGPLLPLAFNSLLLTGGILLAISGLRSALIRSKELARCAYFPIADAAFRRERVMKGAGFLPYVAVTAPLFVWLAQGRQLSTFGWLAVIALAVMQGVLCDALVITCVGYSPKPWSRDWLAGTGLLIVFSGVFAALGGAYLVPYERPISWVAILLLPSGWVNGAFHYGLLEGHPAAWLLLVPAVALVVAAWRWLRSAYSVIEFTFPAPCEAEAEFAPHVLRKPPRPGWTSTERPSAAADYPAAAPVADDLNAPITDQRLLAPLELSRRGWVERFTLRRLSERQRLLNECRSGGSGPWPFAWYTAAFCLLLAAIPVPFHPRADELFSLFGLAGLFLATIDFRPDSPRLSSEHAWMDYHPVGFRELGATILHIAGWRMVAIAPLALAAMVARCYFSGFVWYWVARLIAAAVAALALRVPVFCLAVSARTDDTSHWRNFAIWGLCLSLIGGGSMVVACGPSALWASVAAAVVALTAWLFGGYYARAFDRGDFDIVR